MALRRYPPPQRPQARRSIADRIIPEGWAFFSRRPPWSFCSWCGAALVKLTDGKGAPVWICQKCDRTMP